MSQHLEIRGVYRKKQRMTYHGRFVQKEYFQYFMEFLPWRGRYISSQHINKELFEEFLQQGVERLPDRE